MALQTWVDTVLELLTLEYCMERARKVPWTALSCTKISSREISGEITRLTVSELHRPSLTGCNTTK